MLFQFPNVVEPPRKAGRQHGDAEIRAAEGLPDPFERTTPDVGGSFAAAHRRRASTGSRASYRRGAVSPAQDLATVSDGRVFTGSQALGLKLIDEVGNKKQAIAWLEREKGVPKDLPVRDWKPSGDNNFGLFSAAAGVAGAVGLSDVAAVLRSLANAASSRSLTDFWPSGTLKIW